MYIKHIELFKLNNKGFSLSIIIYIILITAIVLMTMTLIVLNNRKMVLDKQKDEILEIHEALQKGEVTNKKF